MSAMAKAIASTLCVGTIMDVPTIFLNFISKDFEHYVCLVNNSCTFNMENVLFHLEYNFREGL